MNILKWFFCFTASAICLIVAAALLNTGTLGIDKSTEHTNCLRCVKVVSGIPIYGHGGRNYTAELAEIELLSDRVILKQGRAVIDWTP